MTSKPVLEPAAQQFADATANPPFLFDLGPEKGREAVDQVQSGDDRQARRRRQRHDGARRPVRRGAGPHRAPARARPAPLPVIVYIHGAGWVFGNAHTHDRLIRELAVGAERRRGVPQLQPLAGGEVPDRDRGDPTPSPQWVAAARRRARTSTRPASRSPATPSAAT